MIKMKYALVTLLSASTLVAVLAHAGSTHLVDRSQYLAPHAATLPVIDGAGQEPILGTRPAGAT